MKQFKTNLNCQKCVAAVRPYLDEDSAITEWSVKTDHPDKLLTIEGDTVTRQDIEQHVNQAGFQVLGEVNNPQTTTATTNNNKTDKNRSFLVTYKPLLLVVAYLVGVVAMVEIQVGSFDWSRSMGNFMGGFFLAFSFFKMLDLKGFVPSFQTYDVLARPVPLYGWAYPFIELGLGIAYLLKIAPLATNLITLVVMLLGLIGVTQALLKKQKIQCACLGTVFDLPMSQVTFVENSVMAIMAVAMIVQA